MLTTCTCSAHIPTGPTVVVVIVGIDAGTIADDVAPGAAANPLLATRSVRTGVPTGPTVVGIGVQIDAGAIAQDLTRRTPCTDSPCTYLSRQTGMTAGATIVSIGVQVDTGVSTHGQSALTDTGATATDRVVAAEWFGRSTGLTRLATGTGRGKAVLDAYKREHTADRAGSHALEHSAARRTSGQQLCKIIKPGRVQGWQLLSEGVSASMRIGISRTRFVGSVRLLILQNRTELNRQRSMINLEGRNESRPLRIVWEIGKNLPGQWSVAVSSP